MAAKFGDLDQYFSPGLELTVKGKGYTVPLASAELGLWCRAIATATGEISEASTADEVRAAVARVESLPRLDGEMTLAQRMLGTAYDEMVADKVEDAYVEFCAATVYIWVIAGEEQAQAYWEAGGDPEARRPGNRAARRAAQRGAATGAKSTGAGGGTRSRASTSGTRSRTKSGSKKASR